MTNFLNRLAGRTLGIIPVAQPIIPARFDPTAERSGQPEGSAADQMGPSTESDSSATTQAASRAHEIELPPHTIARFREPTLPHTRQPAIPRPPIVAETHSYWSHLQDAESSAALPYTGQRQQHHYAAHANTEPMHTGQATAQAEVFSTSVLEDPRLRDQHRVFADRVPSTVHSPVPKQVQHPVYDPVPNQSSSSAAPIIRITIGRIDVCAEIASPPTSNAARRTRPSTLSLDQYLKQRSEVVR